MLRPSRPVALGLLALALPLVPVPAAAGLSSSPSGVGAASPAGLVAQLAVPGAGGHVDNVVPTTGVLTATGTDLRLEGKAGLGTSLTRLYRPGRWVGASACDNGVDDDGDGLADVGDAQCASTADDSEAADAPTYDTTKKPARHLPDKSVWPYQLGSRWALFPAGLVYHHYRAHPAALGQGDATADYLTFTTPAGSDVTLLADSVTASVPACVSSGACTSAEKPVVTATVTYSSAQHWKASVTTRYEGRGVGTSSEKWTVHRDVDVRERQGLRFTCQAGVVDAKAGYGGKDTYLPFFSTCSTIGDHFGNEVRVRYSNVDDRGFSSGGSPNLSSGPKISQVVDTYGRTIRCSYSGDLLDACWLDANGDASASVGERAVRWEYQAWGGSHELVRVRTGHVRADGSFESLPTVWSYQYRDVAFGTGTTARVLASATDYRGGTVAYGYGSRTVAKAAATGGTLTGLATTARTLQETYGDGSTSLATSWEYTVGSDGRLTSTATGPDGETSAPTTYDVSGSSQQPNDGWGAVTRAGVTLPDGASSATTVVQDTATPAALTSLAWTDTNADGTADADVVLRRRPPTPAARTHVEVRAARTYETTESSFDQYGRPGQVVVQELSADRTTRLGLAATTKTTYWEPGAGVWLVGSRASTVATTYGTNTAGPTSATEYDRWGRPTSQSHNGMVTQTTAYHKSGPVKSVTDALGRTTTYEWGTYANQASPTRTDIVRDALGGEASYTYDVEDRLVEARDRLGRVTAYEYDELGRLTKVTPPAGSDTYPGLAATVVAYPSATKAEATTQARATTATVDTLGRPRSTAGPTGVTESIEYGSSGVLAKVTTKDGSTTVAERSFDAQGRLKTTKALAGTASLVVIDSRTYDSAGRLASVTTPNTRGSVTSAYSYDTLAGAAVCTSACPHSVAVATTYTPTGGSAAAASTSYTLFQPVGSEDRVVARSEDAGKTWLAYSYTDSTDPAAGTYDRFGQLRSISSPSGISYTYTYDEQGRLATEVRAGAARTSYTYETGPNGGTAVVDCTTSQSASGARTDSVVCRDLDEIGRPARLVDKTGGGATELVSYDYSDVEASLGDAPDATTVSVRDDGATYTYTHDVAGRLVQRGAGGATTAWHYDEHGRLARLDYPTGLGVRYAFDAKDRVTSVAAYTGETLEVALVSGVSYNSNGSVREVGYGNGTKATYTIDDYGRATSLKAGRTNELVDRGFDYDAAGRLATVTSASSPERQYAYDDGTGALVGETIPGLSRKNLYELDAVGNRLKLTVANSTTGAVTRTDTYAYGGMELTSVSSTAPATDTYGWPAESGEGRSGHLASSTSQSTPPATGTLAWDRRGRLASFTKATAEAGLPAGRYEYAYDDTGERRKKTKPDGTVVSYHRDGAGQVLSEVTSGGKTYEYVYWPGGRVARLDAARRGDPTYFVNDGHGSQLAAVDGAGNLLQKVELDAFGNVLSPATADLVDRHVFSTYELDPESRLHYAHARYYDSVLGRFLSRDPSTDMYRVWDHNPYSYAYGNPVAFTDPDGRVELGGQVGRGGNATGAQQSTQGTAPGSGVSNLGCLAEGAGSWLGGSVSTQCQAFIAGSFDMATRPACWMDGAVSWVTGGARDPGCVKLEAASQMPAYQQGAEMGERFLIVHGAAYGFGMPLVAGMGWNAALVGLLESQSPVNIGDVEDFIRLATKADAAVTMLRNAVLRHASEVEIDGQVVKIPAWVYVQQKHLGRVVGAAVDRETGRVRVGISGVEPEPLPIDTSLCSSHGKPCAAYKIINDIRMESMPVRGVPPTGAAPADEMRYIMIEKSVDSGAVRDSCPRCKERFPTQPGGMVWLNR